jgi:hypothetical protein
MPRYKVIANIKMDKQRYTPGDAIELSEAQAAELPWAIGEKIPEDAQQETPGTIEAIDLEGADILPDTIKAVDLFDDPEPKKRGRKK